MQSFFFKKKNAEYNNSTATKDFEAPAPGFGLGAGVGSGPDFQSEHPDEAALWHQRHEVTVQAVNKAIYCSCVTCPPAHLEVETAAPEMAVGLPNPIRQ